MKRLILTFVWVAMLGLSWGGIGASASAGLFDGFKNEACKGLLKEDDPATAANEAVCDESSGSDLTTLLKTVLNILSLVVGVIAVISIIIGGLKFITAQGESASIASARTTIIYAAVGIIVAAVAQVIVRFVLAKTTS